MCGYVETSSVPGPEILHVTSRKQSLSTRAGSDQSVCDDWWSTSFTSGANHVMLVIGVQPFGQNLDATTVPFWLPSLYPRLLIPDLYAGCVMLHHSAL